MKKIQKKDKNNSSGNGLDFGNCTNPSFIASSNFPDLKFTDAIVTKQASAISSLEARTLSQDSTITDLSNNVNLSNQKIATLETTIETLKTALNELLNDAGKPAI